MKGLEDKTVAMQVMDHDRFSHDDAIGDVFVPMRGVPVNTNPAYWKRVQRHTHPKVGRQFTCIMPVPGGAWRHHAVTVLLPKDEQDDSGRREMPQFAVQGSVRHVGCATQLSPGVSTPLHFQIRT